MFRTSISNKTCSIGHPFFFFFDILLILWIDLSQPIEYLLIALICMRDFWDKECNRQLSIVIDTSLIFPQIPSEWAQRGMSPSGMPNSLIYP